MKVQTLWPGGRRAAQRRAAVSGLRSFPLHRDDRRTTRSSLAPKPRCAPPPGPGPGSKL